MDESLIRLEDVCFRYANSQDKALRGINVEIAEGDYVAFCGTSGSGKSTLLSILGLINKPSEGEFWLSGVKTSALTSNSISAVKNQEIGFVFQNFNLLSRMTVFENVILPLTYNNKVPRRNYKNKAVEVLRRVGMEEYLNRKPHELSGGQQQRVAIARALICEPSLILADEPTGNLDVKNTAQIYNLLKSLNEEGKTVCLITHDERYAKQADKQFFISDGRLQC